MSDTEARAALLYDAIEAAIAKLPHTALGDKEQADHVMAGAAIDAVYDAALAALPDDGREDVELLAREVDALVSEVHDYVYPRSDGSSNVDRDQANAAIWAIHHRLRPLYASLVADEADVRPLRTREDVTRLVDENAEAISKAIDQERSATPAPDSEQRPR